MEPMEDLLGQDRRVLANLIEHLPLWELTKAQKQLFTRPDAAKWLGEQMKLYSQTHASAKVVLTLMQYWRDRKGLYVYPSLITHVLPYAKEDESKDVSTCEHIDLTRNMSDSEIIEEYMGGMEEVKKRAFTLNQIRTLIDAQWNGESEGLLIGNSTNTFRKRFSNIFYVLGERYKLFAVEVFWRDGHWNACAWEIDFADGWLVGCRIIRNKI